MVNIYDFFRGSGAKQEVARFELTHPTYIKVFFYFILLALTFPSFFPFYIDTPFGKESFGRYVRFYVTHGAVCVVFNNLFFTSLL